MNGLRGVAALLSCLIAFGSQAAIADPVTVNIVNPLDPGLTVTFKFSNLPSTTYAGVFNTDIMANGQTSSVFDTYCIDLYHDFGGPITQWTADTSTTWNVGSNSDSSNPGVAGIGGAMAYLYDQYDPAVVAAVAAAAAAQDPQHPEVAAAFYATARLDAAALQVALWSVEYNGTGVKTDDQSNLAPGRFYLGAGDTTNHDLQNQVYTLANSDIASIGTNQGTAIFYISQRDALSQDLIGPGTVNIPLAIVPEPSSVAMVAVGLGVVVLRRVRNSRRDA